MFLLCCCGDNSGGGEPTGAAVNNSVHESQPHPEPVDGPVIIEPLPDPNTLQLAHPSVVPEKSVTHAAASAPELTAAPAPAPGSGPETWQVFEDTPPQKDFASTPPFVAAAAAEQPTANVAGEQVDMHSALDERISARDYILSITDDKLSRLPIAFVESFYPHLSPSEIMQLEQRLCELKTRMPDERRPEPIPVESENFLRSYRPQITIRTDTGFQVDNKRSSQNGLDIRQLILAAKSQKIGPLDSETLKQLQPFLSVIEFQDVSEKMGPHTPLQKQQPDLQLSDSKKDSSAASSYVYNARPLNSNIYHLTTEPSFSADESVGSDDPTEPIADMKPPPSPPLIKITDTESEKNAASVEPGNPNEEMVKSLVDDVLMNM